MQIVGALFSPTVDVSRLQQKITPVGLQPTPETERAPTSLRPERTVIPTASVNKSTPAATQTTSSVAALQRQLYEFGLRIITGGFSRLVVNILGLIPTTPTPQVAEKPMVDSRPKSVPPIASIPTLQPPTVAPIPTVATPPAAATSQLATKERPLEVLSQVMPATIGTPFTINPKNIQGSVVPTLTPAQTPSVTPIPPIVAAVSEVARSAPLDQDRRRRLDIFDVQFFARNHVAHAQAGSRLDIII